MVVVLVLAICLDIILLSVMQGSAIRHGAATVHKLLGRHDGLHALLAIRWISPGLRIPHWLERTRCGMGGAAFSGTFATQ